MAEEDEDKTTFYAGERVFCYKKMPFGLKNAGATYQRLVDKVFNHQIGRNLKVYVDNMVIKSTSEKEMLKDIQETFERFRSINIKLNSKKCSLGVKECPFLRHLITKQGIKANPSKVKAVIELNQPRTLKDIQSLNEKLAALSRFLSKGAKRSLASSKNASRFLGRIPFEDNEKKEKPKEVPDTNSKWRFYTDEASNSDGSGAGLMLIYPEGKEYTYTLRFGFEKTNNEAEYEALLAGTFVAKQTSIKDYLQKVKTALRGFEEYTVEQVRMNQNKKADALSKMALMTFKHLTKEVLVEVLTKRSIEEKEVLKEQSAIRKAGTSEAIAAGSTRPFSHWRIHILGPLPMPPKGLQFLAIAFERSTKWVEAEPLTTINERQVEKFVWEYMVCKFGVPQIISSKEEKYFKEGMFADLCKGLKVTQSFSPIIEHIEIMHHIEWQLTRSQQGWVDNLAKTLWIHRTLPRNSQKETPFSLTYGSEAVIPIIETTDDRGRVQKATKGKESKEVASIEKAYYRNKLRKYHSARSSHPMYIVGDFVLLKRNANEWQGPYIINEVHKEELYTIVDTTDHSLVQTTKGTSLRKFYM
ncbi:reverse transcriptase domain-containing protein [Tanacetum coccineum]